MTERSEAETSTDQLRPSQASLVMSALDQFSPFWTPPPLSAEDRRIADAF